MRSGCACPRVRCDGKQCDRDFIANVGMPLGMRTVLGSHVAGDAEGRCGPVLPFQDWFTGLRLFGVEVGVVGQLQILERLLHALGGAGLEPGVVVDIGLDLLQGRCLPSLGLALPHLREERDGGLGSHRVRLPRLPAQLAQVHEQVPDEPGRAGRARSRSPVLASPGYSR